MMVPIPSAVADPAIVRGTDAHIGADRAHMGAHADAAGSNTCTRAHRPYMGAGANVLA